MPDTANVVELLTAVAALLTAAGTFLAVLPKLGVHGRALDAMQADVTTMKNAVTAVEPTIPAPTPTPAP